MAFKFMNKIRRSFNSRRNARKQMRKPSFERKTSVSPENHSNLNDEINIESSIEPAEEKQTVEASSTSSNETQSQQEAVKSSDERENEPADTTNQLPEESKHDLGTSAEDEEKSKEKKSELDSHHAEVKKA